MARQMDELQFINRLLFFSFIVVLVFDFWDWNTKPVDWNHLPFFLSVVLGASALALWIIRQRFFKGMTRQQRDETMRRTEADSCLRPDRTYRDQGLE